MDGDCGEGIEIRRAADMGMSPGEEIEEADGVSCRGDEAAEDGG